MARILLALALAGCSASSKPPPAPPPPAVTAEPGIAPRPFTADQIRDAMPAGTQIQFRLVEPPRPPVMLRWLVTAADAQAATIATQVVSEDGTLLEDGGVQTTAWTDLVKHATFPAEQTTRTESSVTVAAGTFNTISYVVRSGAEVKSYHFARSLPGPPILAVEEKDGKLTRRMELVARTGLPARSRVTAP